MDIEIELLRRIAEDGITEALKYRAPVWAPESTLSAVEREVWGSMTIWELDESLLSYSVQTRNRL
jgi:hypothetical protein